MLSKMKIECNYFLNGEKIELQDSALASQFWQCEHDAGMRIDRNE